ncbi:MAG: NUDIX hydrolase [Candidatus Nanoarchaeia archaeon]
MSQRENKVLVIPRAKYPFKTYQEFPASKLRRHETLEQAAVDRLKSKVGLKGNVQYKGIEFLQTKENNELIMHHHLHIFLAENPQGESTEGEWVDIEPFNSSRPLPHI